MAKGIANYSVLYVGVNAPVEILEAREKMRGNRIIGSACQSLGECVACIINALNLD